MDKSKTKSSKQKMLQIPVDVEWFDNLKEQAFPIMLKVKS